MKRVQVIQCKNPTIEIILQEQSISEVMNILLLFPKVKEESVSSYTRYPFQHHLHCCGDRVELHTLTQ